MPVARSRVIIPKAEAKIVAKAIDVGSFEPETPVKSGEGLDQRSNASPLSSGPLSGCKDTLSYESRPIRRSTRLASKSSMDSEMVSAKVQVSGRKRKSLSTAVKEDCINGSNLGLTQRNVFSSSGNGALSVEAEKPVVISEVHAEVGGMKSLNGAGERAKEEKLEPNNSGSSTDSGAIGWDDKNILNFKKGKREREPDTEVDFFGLEYAVQNATEKKSLTLRSGRSIETTGVKRKSVLSSKNGENSHENVCFEEAGSGSSGWMCNTVAEDANSKQTEDGSLERIEKFIIEDEGKKEVAEKLSPDSALTLSKLNQEAEKADGNRTRTRSRTKIDQGKEKLVINEKEDDTKARRMISTSAIAGNDNKGKEKLSIDDIMSKSIGMSGCRSEERVETGTGSTASTSSIVTGNLFQASDDPIQTTRSSTSQNRGFRERFRDIAKRNASRFAHFPSLEEEDNHTVDAREGEVPPAVVNKETEDWPGPFSTAKKIIKDRQMASMQQNSTLLKSESTPIVWIPKKVLKNKIRKDTVPSLLDICLCSIAENADAITSLDCVPDVLRHKLSDLLCDSRKIDEHFLGLLVHGSPTEIHVRECSWITEEIFTKTFSGCDTSNLTVLHLDQCGASLPDYILSSTLAHSPNCLPSLTSSSLLGAYRLSDAGLSLLVASAPALRSINLSQCSLLTSNAIHCLASSVGPVLMELYIDECQGIDAMIVLPALIQFQNLEVLSLTNIGSVSDDFIIKFVPVRGHSMKELILRNCIKLTDSSVRMIAEYCPKLCAIDLSNLNKLTDSALEYLADGCRTIHTLKFCRNGFSDEAVAAYLETCGEPLRELSLSNINMVAHNTATSLARHSKNLHSLDLSWCRKLTNEAFGLIVDNCTNLKMLKVFGCTQISNVFLDGHSNTEVQIIGLKMKPILEHLTLPGYLQGPLRHSFVMST